jgi:translation initiation factor IF-3
VRNNHRDKNNNSKRYIVNEQIRAREIRLITEEGENIGVVSRQEALSRAENVGLDLVKIGEKDSVVIAKIMDFGKYLYLKKKQQGEAKKKQKIIQIKEVKMRPNIGEQDYQTKFKRAIKFLLEGKRVKFTLQFKGREMIMKHELGKKFFERIANDLEEKKLGSLVSEREQRSGPFWSKIYYIKGT